MCYVRRLRIFERTIALHLGNILGRDCHDFLSIRCIVSIFLFLLCPFAASPQLSRPPQLPPPPPPPPTASQPNVSVKTPRPNAPPPGIWEVRADKQETEGSEYHLRGKSEIEGTELLLTADEIDYNEDTCYAEARGNVHFQHFQRNEELRADKVEYDTCKETGKFYNVRGWTHAHIDARPGTLTTNSPLYFEGQWAEKLQDKYILHYGWVTNCKLPNPWWTLRGPKFDITPEEHAVAYRTTFRLRRFPLFYAPFFYKSLEKVPRRSGFLTPNIGNSSRRGKMIGVGYFWAINRSYDLTYRVQDFTQRGVAHHVDFRGKPRAGTDFDAVLYGVNDRGQDLGNGERRKEGGFNLYVTARSDIGRGFFARGDINYLSSLRFRQAFTESFNEAIFSEVHSVGFIAKQWSSFTFDTVFARLENFQSVAPHDSIVIRKLPELSFSSRDRQVWKYILPLWVSFQSTGGLLRRGEPGFETRNFVDRADFAPRVTTALRWKDFNLIPSFSVRETHYGERQELGRTVGNDINRTSREVTVDLITPAFERVFNRKSWLGDKLKHVIEPRASFRYISGVRSFDELIRFDENELLTNTKEAEISLTNRIYAKRGDAVSEIFSWQLRQRRYFDPTFGGTIVEGKPNVILSSVDITAFPFFNRPRRYSPVVSVFRANPKPGFGVEWRADYDPLRGGIVNSSLNADFRLAKYYLSMGHSQLRCQPLLPTDVDVCQAANPDSSKLLNTKANQFRGRVGFGDPNHRGWNAAFDAVYDYRLGIMQFATTQVTYNTDCCGISVQFRRFNFGTRNENQFRVAFAVANIGSFGTLKKQERLF